MLTSLKNKYTREEDLFGREVILGWMEARRQRGAKVLDVGCGSGTDLLSLRAVIQEAELHGLDIMPMNIDLCRSKGIETQLANLECDRIPHPDGFFDVVIANQVFEHLKNWVQALWQIALKLKAGGTLVVGVPNLASFHNRVLLLMGSQPPCISTGGMHVRGFTVPGLRSVLEYKGVFQVEQVAGRPFYPFPKGPSDLLSGIFPAAAVCIFLLCRKTGDPASLMEIESFAKREEFQLN
jgi:SAM-dependent methyltransferase